MLSIVNIVLFVFQTMEYTVVICRSLRVVGVAACVHGLEASLSQQPTHVTVPVMLFCMACLLYLVHSVITSSLEEFLFLSQ